MLLKIFKTAMIFLCLAQSAFAVEKIKGEVIFCDKNSKNTEIEKIQNTFLSVDKKFIDLNYSIEFKPLDIIGESDIIQKSSPKMKSNITLTPKSYEISLSTGNVKANNSTSSTLKELILKNPKNEDLYLALAIQLKQENKLEEAKKTVNYAIEIEPDFALAHFLLADILRAEKNYKEAVFEYLQSAQLNPLCSDAYYNIAKILEMLDDRELALDYYKLAYQINPNDSEIRDIILDFYTDSIF